MMSLMGTLTARLDANREGNASIFAHLSRPGERPGLEKSAVSASPNAGVSRGSGPADGDLLLAEGSGMVYI